MPSLAQATVLFLSFGLCSARYIHSHTPHGSHHTRSYSSSPTATLDESDVLPTSYPSQIGGGDDASLPTVVSSVVSKVVPSAGTSSAAAAAAAASPTSASAVPKNGTTSATNAPDGFVPGVKWQIAIQDPVDIRGGLQPLDAKVVDVDLFLASKDPTLIPALHDAGVIVLCYFNAGAIQYTDCDFPDWNTDGLFSGKSVANYDQERYVDVTSSTVVGLHKARVDLAHSIGCDGIDPDNIDTYELDAEESIGKQITQGDMVSFLKTLADYAHSKTTPLGRPMMIGQKNAVEITESVHSFMDFAISENCVGSQNVGSNRGATTEFCSSFKKFYVGSGKPVFDIEYPASLASGSGGGSQRRDALNMAASQVGCSAGTDASDMEYYCALSQGNSTGISRILKLDNSQFGLNGCTQYCAEASSFLLPTYQSNETNSCCFGSQC